MANVQSQLEKFNDTIRLGRFEENQILRDKRDIIRSTLKANLPSVFAKYGEPYPANDFCDQGSYEMDTGVKPLAGEYDIDQGLYFAVSPTDYPDPVVLKQRVYEALDGHTKHVELRRSCVTVFYSLNDEPIYHVDIAVYSDADKNPDGKPRHAKGKLDSEPEKRIWEVSNPPLLSETIFARFSEAQDRKQFRRIVRYLKRWKSIAFTSGGGSAPNGIGLTLLAYYHLQTQYFDRFANKHNDLLALRLLIERVLGHFTTTYDKNGQLVERLQVTLPIEPGNDVFDRMTGLQMATFKEKLSTLKEALEGAEKTSDIVEACQKLNSVFGDDFLVPSKEETAVRHPPAIVSSGNSA